MDEFNETAPKIVRGCKGGALLNGTKDEINIKICSQVESGKTNLLLCQKKEFRRISCIWHRVFVLNLEARRADGNEWLWKMTVLN